MADMHVLDGDGSKWRVVMHFAVPNVNNAVGVNYRTALVKSGLGGTTQLADGTGPGQIMAAEKTLVESGAVLEHAMSVSVDGSGQTTGGRKALLRSLYTSTKNAVMANLQSRLKFYGHTESEV